MPVAACETRLFCQGNRCQNHSSEWDAIIRSKPLGKREVAALKSYLEADGAAHFYAGGDDTNKRLEVQGLIEKSVPLKDRMQIYRITSAGGT